MKTNSIRRTFPDAHTAANTFGMVRRFRYVHSHFASFCAFSAGYAFAGIHFHLKQRNLVQQGIERTKRTQPFAERAERLFAKSEEVANERFEHLQRLVELYK